MTYVEMTTVEIPANSIRNLITCTVPVKYRLSEL